MATVLANLLCLALMVSLPHEDRHAPMVCSQLCKALFFTETFVRFAGCPLDRSWYQRYPYLVVDVVLAVAGFVEIICIAIPDRHFGNPHHKRAIQVRISLAVVQVLRVYRVLTVLKELLPPLKMMTKAINGGLVNVTSAACFVSIIWLTASMFFCALIRYGGGELQEDVQIAIQRFESVGDSLLTIIEITTGGMCWGTRVVDPLMKSQVFSHKLGAVGMFILMLTSTFLVWNLVLGVYVRQIVMISADNEIQLEMHQVHEGEENVRCMKTILKEADINDDGCISRRELKKCLAANDQALKAIGLGSEELEALHFSIDMDNVGKVMISDLLFGVLKLKGLSRTLDMLSIDFRQKMLERGMRCLEASSHKVLDELAADLDVLQAHIHFLHEKITELRDNISKAKTDLWAEAERLRKVACRMHRFAIQNQQLAQERRKKENLEVRRRYEAQIDMLQAQVHRLSHERNMSLLSMAGPKDIEELRRTVQRRLDTEVGPWLEAALAQATEG